MTKTQCPVCEEQTLSIRTGPGRSMRHRLMEVVVPDDFPLPECSNCGARPITLKTAKALDPILQAEYERRLSELVNKDLEQLAEVRPLYEWERIIGVSKGWLSKIREAKPPSPQLVALVRLLANEPTREHELRELWSATRTSHLVTSVSSTLATARIAPVPARVEMRVVVSDFVTLKAA